MPIRRELRPLYPPHWPALSRHVRFERDGGACRRCGRPHGAVLRCLPDGRWFDPECRSWRDRRGRPARWPDLEEAAEFRTTRVVLAAAHLDHDPANNRQRNLRSLCQRCHLLQDRAYHRLQRWITYRLRDAAGDLFLGHYRHGREAAVALAEILARIAGTSASPGPGIAGRGGVRQTPRLKDRPAPALSWPDTGRDWLHTTDQEHSWHVPPPAAEP